MGRIITAEEMSRMYGLPGGCPGPRAERAVIIGSQARQQEDRSGEGRE